MHKERIAKLKQTLVRLRDQPLPEGLGFSMSFWCYRDECGTRACLGGHYVLEHQPPELEFYRSPSNSSGWCDLLPEGLGSTYIGLVGQPRPPDGHLARPIMEYFDLPPSLGDRIFCAVDDLSRKWPDSTDQRVWASYVLEMIELIEDIFPEGGFHSTPPLRVAAAVERLVGRFAQSA